MSIILSGLTAAQTTYLVIAGLILLGSVAALIWCGLTEDES